MFRYTCVYSSVNSFSFLTDYDHTIGPETNKPEPIIYLKKTDYVYSHIYILIKFMVEII